MSTGIPGFDISEHLLSRNQIFIKRLHGLKRYLDSTPGIQVTPKTASRIATVFQEQKKIGFCYRKRQVRQWSLIMKASMRSLSFAS